MIFKRVCSSALAAALLLTGSAFASDAVKVKYNNNGKYMEIKGNVGNESNVLVSVSVYEQADNIDFSKPVLFSSVYTSENGQVDFDLKTSSDFRSGKYVIYLSSKSAKTEGTLNYVSEEGLRDAMALVNDENESIEIAKIIKSSRRNLGLDENESDAVIETTAEILSSVKKDEYTDPNKFYEEFVCCLAMAYLNETEDTLAVLEKYETELDVDVSEITSLESRTLNKLYEGMKNADYTKGSLSSQLPVLTYTAEILKCESWSELKYVILGLDEIGQKINNNFEVFNPDTQYYDIVENINDVYKKMLSELDDVKNLDDLRKLFEKSAEDVYRQEADSPKGSGGGGGGSSSGGSKVSLNPFVPIEIITPEASLSQDGFSDIESHWAKADIEALASSNVISGYPDGRFMPDKAVTRAEFVKLITLAFDTGETKKESEFSDVSSDAWYKPYVDSAVGAGLIKGVSETSFNPDGLLSREDASLILYRYISGISELESEGSKFNDDSEISDYAKDAVYELSSAGIINGIGNGEFAPKSELTRAQACKLLNSINAYLEALEK